MNRAQTMDERRIELTRKSKLRMRAISTKCGIYTSHEAKE